jgi:ABC-type long-subunit fatty acid transport system fused permease/ATPase subunit
MLIDKLTQWIDHPKKVATILSLGNRLFRTYFGCTIEEVVSFAYSTFIKYNNLG